MNLQEEVGHHVADGTQFHFPFYTLELPKVFGFQITKYMVLEVLVAVLLLLVFIPLARRIRTGEPLRGVFGNLIESILVFIRDEVARPAIGRHDADRFLPYLWTVFFFILFCNLMGMVPWAGSPTGSIAVTAVLAISAFLIVIGAGMKKHGGGKFWIGLVPHMDVPLAIAIFLIPLMFVLEVVGLVIRHGVLAIRLLANMFAGHLVLAVLLVFIGMAASASNWLWGGVTVGSITGSVGLSVLELFVAFLQAYIFSFLSALFIGMALHQH
jgi:F-type H+-transporting ATPase subunit a